MGFNNERSVYLADTWTEFREYLDGTVASLSFFVVEKPESYRIVTEMLSSIRIEYCIIRDGGADEVDFTTNFQNLVPRPTAEKPMEKVLYDFDSEVVNYIGRAPFGTAPSAPAWRITRISFSGGNPTSTLWSGPTAVWDDRATESYS